MKILNQHRKCKCLNCDFDYYAFALGQSPFPVPETLKSELARNATEGQYSEADGILKLRESIVSFNKKHFDLDVDVDRVIVGPGTHTLLFMIFSIVDAKPIIPTPTWIGYNPMLDFLGKEYIKYPLLPENDYKIDPDALSDFLSKNEGKHILVINNPHNPSGAVYSKKELERIVEVCRKYSTLIIADEIYALTTHDFNDFTSLASIYPEGAFVTNGISKDRSAGGYRLGNCIVPKQESSELRDAFATVASSLYSNVATPIQLAAVSVYKENPEIEEYFNITREINRLIGLKISEKCNEIEGLKATVPYGGFYFILDFNQISEKLKKGGIESSNQLSEALLSHPHHIATLTGDALLVSPENYIARIAFVDYDGGEAYKDYKKSPPKNQLEQETFVEKHAAHMLEGVSAIEKFTKSIIEEF
jgi:aspartate aminotransferase